MLDFARKALASERLRHAIIAILLAAMAAALTILRPLDIAFWSLQSKMFEREPSEEIVLVTSDPDSAETSLAAANETLSKALKQLDKQGAELIVINAPLQKSGNAAVDRELSATLLRSREQIFLNKSPREDVADDQEFSQTAPYFAAGMQFASNDLEADFLNFVWAIEAEHSVDAKTYPALWNVLASSEQKRTAVSLDYSIVQARIPTLTLGQLAQGNRNALEAVRGKRVVIDDVKNDSRELKLPVGDAKATVSPTVVHIIAAETVLRGAGQIVYVLTTVSLFGLVLLFGVVAFKENRRRRQFYIVWVTGFPVLFILAAYLGVRTFLADPAFIAGIYAICRVSARFKRRHLYIDTRSKLPNFVALRRDLDDGDDKDLSIVVAKVARLDAAFVSMTPAEQGRYLRQVAARLTLGDERTTIYYDGGKYFAFVLSKSDYPDLQSHLEGLRAVATQAVTVSDRALDVSMTIGADESAVNEASKRINSAIAAADQAREAYRPVFVISDFETDSETWDYSLQSRLEDALSQNRISIKLQPQADLRTGLFTGAEALARWVDDERGEIPPSQFILQCERVGRLDELTKRVLHKSFSASRILQDAGLDIKISVNVSAIQFVDSRIADQIEKTLVKTGADPRQIQIEMTESARVEDFAAARDIMERIGKTGISFSIDDFGVASANLDALYQLPFSELKIDRMFVDQITRSPAARAIVANLITLSRDMRITSVAEGIETRETLEKLTEMGCDMAQGFYLSRPQPLSQLKETLRLQKDTGSKNLKHG